MTFKQYLRREFGNLASYKMQFMAESCHYRHDWIKLINHQYHRYRVLKKYEEELKND